MVDFTNKKYIKFYLGSRDIRSYIDAVHASPPDADKYTGDIVEGIINEITCSGIIATVSRREVVQRRDNLRTDRRIVLRTCAYTFPWIKFRSWLIRSLRDSFFGGKVHLLFMKNKPGILNVVEMRPRSSIEVLKRFRMWHPPLLKSTNKIRGGMDATIEAFA